MAQSGETARTAPDGAAIEGAARTIAGHVRDTPIVTAGEVSRRLGAPVVLKAENLQRTGSFKLRGAVNRVAALSAAELERGVVAASAGNHAQAVAVAARARGSRAFLYMPDDAPIAKVEAVRRYGGEVRLGAVVAGRITAWEMKAGSGVTIEADAALHPYWKRTLVETELPRGLLRVRLRRSANPAYDLTFDGDVAQIQPRLVLHRCKECSS